MAGPPAAPHPLDEDFLAGLELDTLPRWEYDALREFLRTTLENRVGSRILECMTLAQIDRWNEVSIDDDPEGALRLMDEMLPGVREMTVRRTLAELADQVRCMAAQILRISRRDVGGGGDRTAADRA